MSLITLRVNGRSHTLDVDPATPLLYVLSDDLALRGPKFGCGLGQCGACTVIVKGQAIRSCVTPVQGRRRRRDHHARRPGHVRAAASDSAGVHRRAGGAVRLLPERRHPRRPRRLLDQQPEGDRRPDPAGAVRRAVPLLRARADDRGDQALRGREDGMTPDLTPDARAALRGGRVLAPRLPASAPARWSSPSARPTGSASPGRPARPPRRASTAAAPRPRRAGSRSWPTAR